MNKENLQKQIEEMKTKLADMEAELNKSEEYQRNKEGIKLNILVEIKTLEDPRKTKVLNIAIPCENYRVYKEEFDFDENSTYTKNMDYIKSELKKILISKGLTLENSPPNWMIL